MERYAVGFQTASNYNGSIVTEGETLQRALQYAAMFTPAGIKSWFTTILRLSDNVLLYSRYPRDDWKGENMDIQTVNPSSGKVFIRFENGQNTGDTIDFDPKEQPGFFNPAIEWIEAPDYLNGYITPDYISHNGKIQPPSVDYFVNQLAEQVKVIRKMLIEQGRVSYKGKPFPTNEKAFSNINEKINYVQVTKQESSYREAWKTDDGYLDVSYKDLVEILKLMSQFKSDVFAKEKTLVDSYRNIKISDVQKVITEFPERVQSAWIS